MPWLCGECHVNKAHDRVHLSGNKAAKCHVCRKVRANIGYCPLQTHVKGFGPHVPRPTHIDTQRDFLDAEPPRTTAMGVVYGLRNFVYYEADNHISGNYSGRWSSPRQRARCKSFLCSGDKPTELCRRHLQEDTCRCGIYARKLDQLSLMRIPHEYGADRLFDGRICFNILCLTELWGTVVNAWSGIRATEALITSILVGSEAQRITMQTHLRGFRDVPIAVTEPEYWYTNNATNAQRWLDSHTLAPLITIPQAEAS